MYKPLVSQNTSQISVNQSKLSSDPHEIYQSKVWAAHLHFSIHIPTFTSRERLHTTPTRRLLKPSRDDSRRRERSCFVSDRCSWPTVRHATSCTKAPLCAINHVKPAWSYKSLLWGNPPFQIYKIVRGASCLPKCCRNVCIDRYQQMRGIWFAVWSTGAM